MADVLHLALALYRASGPSYIRSFGYRDEILAAYLEAFCQVPARTNFVPANLSLLNHFVLQPADYTNASAAELMNSGNQRLLSDEESPAQRDVQFLSWVRKDSHWFSGVWQ